MLPELPAILRNRRRLGLTQSELAKLAGVSQSLVAKIESGRLDPAYSKAKRLLDSLERLGRNEEKKAQELMHAPVVAVEETQALAPAVSLMRKRGFSQLPVENKTGKIVGSLSERAVVDRFEKGDWDAQHATVGEVMDEPFPTVSQDTPASAVAALLHEAQAVLVLRGGKSLGIITKADLLKAL